MEKLNCKFKVLVYLFGQDTHREVCQVKEGLSRRIVESQSDNDRLSADKASLEEQMIDLQKQLNTAIDQTNGLRVSFTGPFVAESRILNFWK